MTQLIPPASPPASGHLHKPVFLDEILAQVREADAEFAATDSRPLQWALDATFGRGGHTRAMLESLPQLKVVAMDQDRTAIEYGMGALKPFVDANRLQFIHLNFTQVDQAREAAGRMGAQGFDFILFDLGVSSPQLDTAERGFSFYKDGPLDMRMDDRVKATAESIINEASEEELVRIFSESGEVERPMKVVRAIVADRKIKRFTSTKDLAGLIERVEGWAKKGFHPATQYFMALRLEVNRELESLEVALPLAMRLLVPGGRLAMITFHSLEDRIVKNFFRAVEEGEWETDFGECVRRKATKPTDREIAENPRARSAKLRVFRRFAKGEKKSPKNKYAHLIGDQS